MTTYYVGAGGNDSNAGTSWALRKLTLNGAEDIPVAAGDTVYVGAGTYRETLTCDVSGASGSPITYIGDYTGANTDGVGGVVRITASDNDKTDARAYVLTAASTRDYRHFKGLYFHGGSTCSINQTAFGSYSTLENCYVHSTPGKSAIVINPGTHTKLLNCVFNGTRAPAAYAVQYYSNGGDAVYDYAAEISNCLFIGTYEAAIHSTKVGNIVIKNSVFFGPDAAFVTALSDTTYPSYIYNCIIITNYDCLRAGSTGVLVENYNLINARSARSNVAVGANSVTYAPLFDTRWFFELVNGGRMITPFDLASYSELVDLAGTSPTTADMRGTTVQGTQREWGALEYDSTLDIEAGSGGGGGAVSIQPLSGRLGL